MRKSDVRNACFRAKANDWRPEQREIQAKILSLLPPYGNWENFTTEWDLTISKSNNIVIIKPEVNSDYIFKVCSEASMKAKNNLPWDWSDREKNIIDIIESEMLDSITTWDNFYEVWTTEVDVVLKRIRVKLLNKSLGQRTVEAHEYEPQPVGDAKPTELATKVNEFAVEPMTEEEIKSFKRLIKKNKGTSK